MERLRAAGLVALLALLSLAAPAPIRATDWLTDVRRPLVPPRPPSWVSYQECYPEDSAVMRWKLSRMRSGLGRFDYTKPDGWNLAQSIASAVDVLRRNGRDPMAAEQLGVWFTLQHEFEAAIESFEAALDLAEALTRDAKDPRAVETKCLAGSPARILVNLANTALLAGDVDLARGSLSRVETASDLPPVARLRWYRLRAELAARAGELTDAREMLAEAERVVTAEALGGSSDTAEGRDAVQAYFRALVAERAGELERAASAYRTAADGGVLDAQIGLAKVYANLGQIEDGIHQLEALSKARPHGSMMRPEIVAYDLGNLRTAAGDKDGARTAYRLALFTVVNRSCEYLEDANLYFDRYCDLEPICSRLKAVPIGTPCGQYLMCVDSSSRNEPEAWWGRTLCRSLEPDLFVAAHNNFAMNLAEDPGAEESIERHLRLAIEGARGSEAGRIPLLNLARTRWQRGELERAVAALFELTEAGGDPRFAASSLWAWLDLQGFGDHELPPVAAFVDLAEQARAQGSSLFRRELGTVETYLASLLDAEDTDVSTRARASTLLASLALSPSADAPSRGPIDAPVTVVAFNDFGCPYCARTVQPLRTAHEVFGDRVRFVFRQFPLGEGLGASKPSEAVRCAADQGKFWELSDLLSTESDPLTLQELKDKARQIDGLDGPTFDACLESGTKAAEVAADRGAGAAAGVAGIPAIFVNGRMLSATVGTDDLLEIIEDELERSQADP